MSEFYLGVSKVPDQNLLFTNITNIVLIVLFLVYRHRVKINQTHIEELRNALRETIIQMSNMTCVCVRLDYQTGKVSKQVVIDVVLSQPIQDSLKIEHLKFAGVTYEEIKEKTDEAFRSYFEQMGEKENNTPING